MPTGINWNRGIIWNKWALIRNTYSMAVVEDNPLKKEKEYVHDVYSQIADHFSDTRFKPWPRIAEFLTSLPSGSLVADIGRSVRVYGVMYNFISLNILYVSCM